MPLFTQMIYIGVDPTAGKKPITFAALDDDLQIVTLSKGTTNELLAFIAGHHEAVVAICAPLKPNIGLMKDEKIRQQLSPPPKIGRWHNYRVAEYILRQHNIHIHPTPNNLNECPKWMQEAFILYTRLEKIGYKKYPNESSTRQFIEVYPQASYAALIEQNPILKNTLEGKLQRQLILYEHKFQITDPMNYFEEITRYKLLKGHFPTNIPFSPQELDALIGAYSSWLAYKHPEQISQIGHAEEGTIVLPVPELKKKY